MVNKDIFGFDITMSDPGVMEVLDRRNQFPKNYPCQFFAKELWILDQAMQLPVTGKLHHIVEDVTSMAIWRAIDSPNLEICDLYNAMMACFCT